MKLRSDNFRRASAPGGSRTKYAYDNLNRLKSMDRGNLNTSETAIDGTPAREEDWILDATGNWSGYVSGNNGITSLQARWHNKANEITSITGSPAWATPAPDLAGNMSSLPKPSDPATSYTAVYDAWNRLVALKSGATPVADYGYDGRGRRILKQSYSGSGVPTETRHFYYSNEWQILEERVELLSPAVQRQYVWGLRYVDELICRDSNLEGTLDLRLYALQDANYNVTAVVDTAGAVQERYLYSPYGVTVQLS